MLAALCRLCRLCRSRALRVAGAMKPRLIVDPPACYRELDHLRAATASGHVERWPVLAND
jgi:hypothetical protein